MGRVVNALTGFVDTKLETSEELQNAQDDSVILLSFAKGKSPAHTVLVKLMDLGAVSPHELDLKSGAVDLSRQTQAEQESQEKQQAIMVDQAISAATEVLHYVSGAGLTPQTVMRAKITGARPFRKFVARSCLGAPDAARFECRKQTSEELLCAMTKVIGPKLGGVRVELEATAAGKTCQLSKEVGAKIVARAEQAFPAAAERAFPAAAALSREGARTRLASDAALDAASRSEQELKVTSEAGVGILHGLEQPEADEEWVQVDNLVRGMLKLLEGSGTPEEWPTRVL